LQVEAMNERWAAATAIILLCIPLSCTARLAMQHGDPDPPQWPKQYSVKFTFSVPYIKLYQKDGLTYHYQIWQDVQAGKQRMERGTADQPDLEVVVEDQNANKMYTQFVHKTEQQCKEERLDGGSGPTMQTDAQPASPDAQRLQPEAAVLSGADTEKAATTARRLRQWHDKPPLTYVLPEVTRERWEYGGETKVDDDTVDTWVFKSEPGKGYGHYTSNYTLSVSKDGAPVKLDIWGINPYTGGHFDHYVARYSSWQAGGLDEIVFDKPPHCKPEGVDVMARRPGLDLRTELLSLLPPAHHGDAEYDQHVHQHGRRHRSQAEYMARRTVFQDNLRFIREWNADQPEGGHMLAMNHWGDVSAGEYRALLAGNKKRRSEWAAAAPPTSEHQPTVAQHMLPNAVDWRGTAADSPVKNQAACGSCWAFGAIGAIETAYYRITGKQKLFSEQNLIDCSWDIYDGKLTNKGCYDGYQQIAFEYVWRTGGIASEDDYPYIGVSSYCNSSKPLTKLQKGVTKYVKGGEKGLMEALLTKGPMTVAVDAGAESFRFYKSGIYNNTHCTVKPVTELDHAVLVSGYGSEGGNHWVVKNTWSANWGEDGYIRIARQPADCGIATEPLYVEFETTL
jgi:cathepsin L